MKWGGLSVVSIDGGNAAFLIKQHFYCIDWLKAIE